MTNAFKITAVVLAGLGMLAEAFIAGSRFRPIQPEPVAPPWLKKISDRGIEETIVFTRTNDLKRVLQIAADNLDEGFTKVTIKFPPRRFDLYEPMVIGGNNSNAMLELNLAGAYFKVHNCSALIFNGSGPTTILGGFFDATSVSNYSVIEIAGTNDAHPSILIGGEH